MECILLLLMKEVSYVYNSNASPKWAEVSHKIRIFEKDEDYTRAGGYRIHSVNLGIRSTYDDNTVFSIIVKRENEVRFYVNNVEISAPISLSEIGVFRPTPNYPLKIIYRPTHNKSTGRGLFNVKATKPEKSTFDISGNWSSTLSGNDVFNSKVFFIDRDVSFNTTYLYGITARAIPVDGVVKTAYFETSLSTDNGIPQKLDYNYKINNANLTLSWTKSNRYK